MMFVLKYGSSSLLYLGLTLMVPLGHLVFSLHSPSSIHLSDVFGLFVLMAGLVLYRFGHDDEVVATTPSASPAAAEGREEGNHHEDGNSTTNEISCKDGFLEFLREPFMLVGDIWRNGRNHVESYDYSLVNLKVAGLHGFAGKLYQLIPR
jgi:hypothetical protein